MADRRGTARLQSRSTRFSCVAAGGEKKTMLTDRVRLKRPRLRQKSGGLDLRSGVRLSISEKIERLLQVGIVPTSTDAAGRLMHSAHQPSQTGSACRLGLCSRPLIPEELDGFPAVFVSAYLGRALPWPVECGLLAPHVGIGAFRCRDARSVIKKPNYTWMVSQCVRSALKKSIQILLRRFINHQPSGRTGKLRSSLALYFIFFRN